MNPIISPKIISHNVAAQDLRKGNKILSKETGRILTVTSNKKTENRSIIVFDGDLEIDFLHFTPLNLVE